MNYTHVILKLAEPVGVDDAHNLARALIEEHEGIEEAWEARVPTSRKSAVRGTLVPGSAGYVRREGSIRRARNLDPTTETGARTAVVPQITLSAGYVRGLAWLAEQHPTASFRLEYIRDEAQVGWLQVLIRESRGFGSREAAYVLSPTGRVWCADPWPHRPTGGGDVWARGEQLREADYDSFAY